MYSHFTASRETKKSDGEYSICSKGQQVQFVKQIDDITEALRFHYVCNLSPNQMPPTRVLSISHEKCKHTFSTVSMWFVTVSRKGVDKSLFPSNKT